VVLILLCVVGLGIMRWRSGVNIVIVRDYRKNRKFDKPISLKMVIDAKSGTMKRGILYRSWISLFQADTPVWELPDLASIKYGNVVYAIRGGSADPNDDNLYFVPLPDLGEVGAMDYSDRISGEIINSLSSLTSMSPRDLALKLRNKEELQKLISATFNDKWVLNKLGVQPITKASSLPRQYKSFLINRLEKEKGFGVARQDLMGKLIAALPMIAVGIAVLLIGIGDYNVAQGNAVTQQANQAYLAAAYTYLNSQNYAIARAMAAAGIYGYNVTIMKPPVPPNYTGITLPTVPKIG
jgi:hypothetical protein